MATKLRLKTRAARAREEMAATGHLVLRAPALVGFAQCAIRFLLSAVLAGAEIFGGYAPFGLALVGASGSGAEGFCALMGACVGYFSFRGFTGGLRYAAASILCYSVAFAFYDVALYRKSWFMPLIAGGLDAATGLIYLSDLGWTEESVIFFATEVLLAGSSVYFYRTAFAPWAPGREDKPLSDRETVSLFLLGGSALLSLTGMEVLGGLSLGRIAVAVLVMAVACKGGMNYGAGAGVTAGIAMDLCVGGVPFYSMSYALSGVMAGIFGRRGRLWAALAYVGANAAAVFWTWGGGPRISALYEIFVASICFAVLPERWLRSIGALFIREREASSTHRTAEYARRRLEQTAEAFKGLHESLRTAFSAPSRNDNDTAAVFDRAADRVCKGCVLRSTCWQQNYVDTYNALNDALPAILERGRGEGDDFPVHFSSRCIDFSNFLTAVNEEVAALFYRRQYHARVRESRQAVCGQYGALSRVLGAAAAELSQELTVDPVKERKLRQHLAALGVEGELNAFYDGAGRLRVEIRGRDLAALQGPEEERRLSAAAGVPLKRSEEGDRHRMVFLIREPMVAVAGAASVKKEGQAVSGDTGAWFKSPDGRLYLLLCDGMGSGAAAAAESRLAVRLLRSFLTAGVEAETALRTLDAALALRGEEQGAFTTIDLLELDLFTGAGAVYKYGGAPTYLRRGKTVSRMGPGSLPAGLIPGEGGRPDVTAFTAGPGDWLVLVSDGVAGEEGDLWLKKTVEDYPGDSPRELADLLARGSSVHARSADDRTILVLRLADRGEAGRGQEPKKAEKNAE